MILFDDCDVTLCANYLRRGDGGHSLIYNKILATL